MGRWGPVLPCVGCDRCSLCFSAVCLPMQARADFTFISYQQPRHDGEYTGCFRAAEGLCRRWSYQTGTREAPLTASLSHTRVSAVGSKGRQKVLP